MSSLNLRESSSASTFVPPCKCAALRNIFRSMHQSQISLAMESKSSFFPPYLLMYAQLVELSMNMRTWVFLTFLQKDCNVSLQAISSKTFICLSWSWTAQRPPVLVLSVLLNPPQPCNDASENSITDGFSLITDLNVRGRFVIH